MARCLQLAALAAKSDVPVVLLGETGTGKTLLAHAIHNSSTRAGRSFIAFNASAISDTLLESQLFGHERGAFTGAQQTVKGKFELADGGTLFLDEISEMSPLAQVKILRVLEYGEFERLGSERMLTSNARIICASNCSLRERVRLGKFRVHHEWRGNLRELSHTVRAMTLFCNGSVILPEHVVFPPDLETDRTRTDNGKSVPVLGNNQPQNPAIDLSLTSAVRRHVRFVFEQANQNQRRAAKLLGISRSTLARHLRNVVPK